MRAFGLGIPSKPIERVMILGAHSDDIEIGAGGTIRELIAAFPRLEVHWVVFAATGQREAEARASAAAVLGASAGRNVVTHNFRDGFFPYEGARIKEAFENLKALASPDVVITHHRDELHQDHRAIAELTWNTFRDHVILEYEIPKYDGGMGSPNFFVPLTAATAEAKVRDLLEHFGTQRSKAWFTAEVFRGLMAVRGAECRSPSGYAEAFYCRKAVWGLHGI
jgi:LmbE family N-acetylglucosaminyl deacetylase